MARHLISFAAHAMDHIPGEDMPALAEAAHESDIEQATPIAPNVPRLEGAPRSGAPSAGTGLDGSTARNDCEDRNDQSDDKDEPEEAANSRPARDRQNDQGNYEDPEQRHEGLLQERTRVTTKVADVSSKRSQKSPGYASLSSHPTLSALERCCQAAATSPRR